MILLLFPYSYFRLGQTCNHVAGLLFRVEHATKLGLTGSKICTSLPCTWKTPKEKVEYAPIKVKDMDLVKARHGKTGMYS